MPDSRIAEVQGGVRPCVEQGSNVTTSAVVASKGAPAARQDASACTSACGPPRRGRVPGCHHLARCTTTAPHRGCLGAYGPTPAALPSTPPGSTAAHSHRLPRTQQGFAAHLPPPQWSSDHGPGPPPQQLPGGFLPGACKALTDGALQRRRKSPRGNHTRPIETQEEWHHVKTPTPHLGKIEEQAAGPGGLVGGRDPATALNLHVAWPDSFSSSPSSSQQVPCPLDSFRADWRLKLRMTSASSNKARSPSFP